MPNARAQSITTIQKYRDTDGFRRWEFLYEGTQLVLLNKNAPQPYCSQLLAFNGFGEIIWCLSPPDSKITNDYIINLWIAGGSLWAGSFSGYCYKINHQTGRIIESSVRV